MPKLTIEDLKKIKQEYHQKTHLREGGFRAKITVHMGTCGLAAGARDILDTVLDEIQKTGITDTIVTTSGCAGLCSREPMITIEIQDKPPVKYADLTKEKMQKIFKEHVQEGKIVEDLALVLGCETSY